MRSALQRFGLALVSPRNRCGDHPNCSFDFLGFTFRARKTMWPGRTVPRPLRMTNSNIKIDRSKVKMFDAMNAFWAANSAPPRPVKGGAQDKRRAGACLC